MSKLVCSGARGLNLMKLLPITSVVLHDREMFGKLGANYGSPTETDFLRFRLLAVYYIGLKHFSNEESAVAFC